MATQVLQNCKCWLDKYELHGSLNAMALEYSAEMLDDTTFGHDTKSNKGGLKTVKAQHEGLWDSDTLDPALFGLIGTADKPMTISPVAGAVGDIAYFFLSNLATYNPASGSVGEIVGFSVAADSTGNLIRGEILLNSAALTASGNGTARELGAVSATQSLYASLHVMSASAADTLDVVVQSDVDANFSTPTTQITFTQATAATSEWKTAAGAIADTFYRISYTIAGTSPSFSAVVAVGIR